MAVSGANRQRWRAILISREVKRIFGRLPAPWTGWLSRWVYRWLFLGPDRELHRAGEILLADLRRYGGLNGPTIFDPDPVVMAYREGRRATAMRIFNYLNLDENDVQQLMELDDGLGE